MAHRGSTGGAAISENGLPALVRAGDKGADMVEFDVRPTLDRRLVVMHDGGLARTTNCQGQVWSRTLADIQASCQLDDGSSVPSFADYVELARRQNLPMMIEIKEGPGWSPEVFTQMRAVLKPLHSMQGSVFLCFKKNLLDMAREEFPEVPGILIVLRQSSTSTAVQEESVGGFLIDAELTTRSWVARAHRHGQLVYGRVVDTTLGWQRCLDIGLDGVLSNNLGRFLAWRARART